MAQQNQKKHKRNKEAITEKDPTIRQEFPGADNTKKKIEAGIRNVKNNPPSAPGNTPPVPPKDNEPVDEQSNNL